MSERGDYAEPGPDVRSPWSIFAAIGRALLFAVACGVLCLIVVELVFGYNMYFGSDWAWFASCYAPAGIAGLMHFGFTARRWFRAPAEPTMDKDRRTNSWS